MSQGDEESGWGFWGRGFAYWIFPWSIFFVFFTDLPEIDGAGFVVAIMIGIGAFGIPISLGVYLQDFLRAMKWVEKKDRKPADLLWKGIGIILLLFALWALFGGGWSSPSCRYDPSLCF